MKKVLLILLLPIISTLSLSAAPSVSKNDILVLHSYHQGLQWTDDISSGIKSVLKSENVEIHYEFLDMKRNSGEDYYNLIVDFEEKKEAISDIDFKLIICSDNHALEFVMEHGERLYPGVPVIFCGVNDFTPAMIEGRDDITGIVETIDYRKNFELICKLHPDRKNFLIIIDQSFSGKKVENELEDVIKDLPAEYSFEVYHDFLFEEIPDKLATLDDEDVILLMTFNRDRSGRFLSYVDGIEMIHKYSPVPIYGAWDFFFGLGIVGGMLTTGHSQGVAAAEMAKEYLAGTSITDIEIVQGTTSKLMFDYNELKRFDINPKLLPRDSLIINKPESPVRKYAYHILTASIIIFLILCFVAVRLIRHRVKERQLEKMNAELERRVNEKTADLTEKVHVIEKQNSELQSALIQIKTLEGIIPMCSKCKKIRNDEGYWKQVEQYISERTDAEFSHGLCPDCFDELFREAKARKEKKLPPA